jgi:hypothetical protein
MLLARGWLFQLYLGDVLVGFVAYGWHLLELPLGAMVKRQHIH